MTDGKDQGSEKSAIKKLTDAVLDLKTVVALVVAVVGAAFTLGILYHDFKNRLEQAEAKIVALDKRIGEVDRAVITVNNRVSALRESINGQFARLAARPEYGTVRRNTTPAGTGGAFNPDHPSVICGAGEFVYGIQPIKEEGGAITISYRCAKLPRLNLPNN